MKITLFEDFKLQQVAAADASRRWQLLILLFMVSLFPFITVPVLKTGFTLPKYIALALVAIPSVVQLISGKVKVEHPSLIPLVSFALFALVSTILAAKPITAWFGVYRYTGFCTYLFCMLLFLLAADFAYPTIIIKWMVAAATLLSCIALLQYLGLKFIPHHSHAALHAYATIGNRNFVGTYTVFILPAAIYFYLRHHKAIWLVSVTLIYAGLLATLTRGAWLALPVPLAIILYHFFKKPPKRKFIYIVCIVLLLTTSVLAPAHDWLLVKRALSIPDQAILALGLFDEAGSGRVFIWKETIKLIRTNWTFGIGPDNLNIPTGPGRYADKAHNIYLEIAVSMGLFAFFSYILFLSLVLRFQRRKHGPLFFTMILAYLLQGFFNIDVVGVMPLFWIVLGLSLAGTTQMHSSPIPCSSPKG